MMTGTTPDAFDGSHSNGKCLDSAGKLQQEADIVWTGSDACGGVGEWKAALTVERRKAVDDEEFARWKWFDVRGA